MTTIVTAVDDVDLERDRSLVLMAQGGDDSAFAALYARYFRRLVRFATKRVGNATEAEEIAQEAFTRAYRALPNFAGDRRFYPWLCVITARLCIDSLRREGRVQVGDVSDEPVIDQGYERLEREGDLAKVVEAMGKLNPRHREVLELRERHGWSYHHIASHYEVSLGTVEALLWRARKALRREYEGLGAIVLAIPGLRRVASMWRNANTAQSATAVAAFGTAAVLTITGFLAPATNNDAGSGAVRGLPITRIGAAGGAPATIATATPIAPGVSPTGGVHVSRLTSSSAGRAGSSHRPGPVVQKLSDAEATRQVNNSQFQVHLGSTGIGANLPVTVPVVPKISVGGH